MLRRLGPDLAPVALPFRSVLLHQEDRAKHAIFPTAGLASLVVVLGDGDSVEAAVVGYTGMVGLPLVLGDGPSPYEVQVLVAGAGWRMAADAFLRHQRDCAPFHDLVLRYAGVVMAQATRQAACHRKHGARQRLGRWLLQARDLVGEDVLALTHEYLAEMLGVRRASVSIEMEALRAAGLIAYRRGRVAILDAPGLERVACEDYRIIRGMHDHLRA